MFLYSIRPIPESCLCGWDKVKPLSQSVVIGEGSKVFAACRWREYSAVMRDRVKSERDEEVHLLLRTPVKKQQINHDTGFVQKIKSVSPRRSNSCIKNDQRQDIRLWCYWMYYLWSIIDWSIYYKNPLRCDVRDAKLLAHFSAFFADYPKNTGPISSFFHWLLSVRRHPCQQHSRSSCSPPSGHNNAVPWQNSQPNKKINAVKRRSQENIDQKYKTTQVKSKPLCGGCRLPLIKSRLGVDLLKKHVWNTLAC